MRTKQTIMIIGASGRMGSAISKSLSGGNYRLLLNGKNHDKINELVNEIDVTNPSADVEGIDCSFDGCWEADINISGLADAKDFVL